MSSGWVRSDLVVGETLKVPSELFVEPYKAQKNLISATYVGENNSGIFIDFKFNPGVCTTEPKTWHYRLMIPWASIWCGHTKICRTNGEQVRAYRKKGQALALGQARIDDKILFDN